MTFTHSLKGTVFVLTVESLKGTVFVLTVELSIFLFE